MSFPVTIDPTSPAGSDSPAQGDDQFRALKQGILDLFGLPASPSSISAALMSVDTTGRWAAPIRLTNKTGGGLVVGDVVAIDSANDEAVALSDTADSVKRFVVAQGTIANNAAGLFAVAGYVTVNTQGAIARGQYLQKSATSKKVEDSGVTISDTTAAPKDAQGVALTAAAAGVATALWWGGVGGGGGVSSTQTFVMELPIGAADLPDATGSGNNPPEILRDVSTGSQTSNSPKSTTTKARYDAATDEHLMWTRIIPANYSSGGTLRLIWKAVSATTNSTVWKGSVAPTVDSSTDDDAVVFNTVATTTTAVAGTQGQTKTTLLTLTMTSVAANEKVVFFVGRDADNGSDNMTGDAELLAVTFEYTGSLT